MTASIDLTASSSRATTADLVWLALPMIGAALSRLLMQTVDFVMISFMGTEAQAAASPSTLLVFTFACIGMGVVQSVQTYVAQADGRREPHLCGAYAWQSLYIGAGWALITLPITLTVPHWMSWIGTRVSMDPHVLEMQIDYLQWGLWTIGPATLCMGLENFFNGIRRPAVTLTAMLASLGANVVLNYALIFGHWGFPALGIAGAAIATLIAWMVRAGVLLAVMLTPAIDARYHTRLSIGPNLRRIRELIAIGGPTALQWLIDIGAWSVFLQVIMQPYGAAALAASNIAIQYMHFSFMPALGIGMALASQVGHAIGQKRHDLAEERVRMARRLIIGYMAVMAVVFLLSGRLLTSLLCFEKDPAVVEHVLAFGSIIMMWVALFQISDAICIVYSFALRGAGDTRRPALLFAICCWVIFVGGGLLMRWIAPGLGINGPWFTCTLYIIVLGALLWQRFHSGAWRSIRLAQPEPQPADPQAAVAVAEPAR